MSAFITTAANSIWLPIGTIAAGLLFLAIIASQLFIWSGPL